MAPIAITHFSDPGCPWAYSASPALAVLRWRYGAQLDWRLVTIGLSEDPARYIERGYTPTRMAIGNLSLRRFGMPFAFTPRARVAATGRACRAIVATRLVDPDREYDVHRALQFGWFTTTLVLDDDADIATALAAVDGLDVERVLAAIDDRATEDAYQADRSETRSAAGGATEMQGKARQTDGPVRFSAPSLVLEADGVRVEAGGFQTVEAYDVLIANLDPTLERQAPPEDPADLLAYFSFGLTTQEVAALLTVSNDLPDREGAERALLGLVAEGRAERHPLGGDALW
ncbi:MAG TPA: DsbA family protein, partial [Solirubrobacteraceae bacterium]|nr:DsbA family protein [Solirubrobacteraceae bacterium]